MHILCPHCRSPIELVKLTPREEINCPSCGSSFCLETQSTTAGTLSGGQRLGRFVLLDVVGQGGVPDALKGAAPDRRMGLGHQPVERRGVPGAGGHHPRRPALAARRGGADQRGGAVDE